MLRFDSIEAAQQYAQSLIDQAELEQTLTITQIALDLAKLNIQR